MDEEGKFSLKTRGFVQAAGVTLYCGLVGIFMWKGNVIFGKVASYFAPVAVLLLFSVSALICTVLVFYQPYKLFFEGKKKEAANLVLYTTLWLFVFFIVFLLLTLMLS